MIAVVGAGIVGCSCALWLQKKGYSVILIDPDTPGSGTSSGNACTIAPYACVPVNHPDVFKKLPSLMFATDGPFSIDMTYAIRHLPWLFAFLAHCRPAVVARISQTLAKLLQKTGIGLDPLIADCQAESLLSRQGCLYLYETQQEFDDAQASNQLRENAGFSATELDVGEIRELEPGIRKVFAKGLLFDQATRVINPQSLSTRYFDCFMEKGGQYCAQTVQSVAHRSRDLCIHLDNGDTLHADRAVIAAGAFSTQIKGVGTSQLPLNTERGYHVQYRGLQTLLNRPVSWNQAGFYATPMDEGLRLAGTVEIAGYSQIKNERHLHYLAQKGRQMFDLPDQPDQAWLGFRPSFPDALPVIGHSLGSEYILYAFGHQHLGLTLAGITGKLIAEIIRGETPCHDIRAFSPRRFL